MLPARPFHFWRIVVISILALMLLVPGVASAAETGTVAIVAANLIDGKSDHVRHDLAILIEGDRIVAIGDVEIIPAQQKMGELSKRYRDEFLANIGAAIRAGVKVAVGSDFGGYDPLINAREFASLVEAGMTPMQAIQAGTRVGAELLGWEDRVGTIAPGMLADIVAVAENPLEDLSELERVIFVMKGGEVVKAP